MSFTEPIDFSKYGINFDYNPDTKKLPESIKNNILPAVFTNNTVKFTKGDGSEISMNLKKKLGAGSYGEAWATDTEIEKGMPLIVKVISARDITNKNRLADYEYDILQEALIQIIIYEATKNISVSEINLIGPFVPKLFLIGKDSKNFYIVSEKLDDSLFSILHRSSKIPTTEFITTSTLHLSKMLIILYEKLKFNHRDLKADNIMYKIINDKINVRFIDFGYSCIKYNNLFLSAISRDIYASTLHCNSKIRDMHSYLYSLLKYSIYKHTKCPIKRIIHALIVIDDAELPNSWSNTYERFDEYNDNDNKLAALNSSPDVIFNVFSSLYFSSEQSCSNILNPDWTKYLAKLYKSTVFFITDDEYKHVSPKLLDDFLLPFLKDNLGLIWKNNVSTDIFFQDFYYKLSDKVYSCDDSKNICKRIQFKAPNNLLPKLFDEFMRMELYKRSDFLYETILHKIARNKESPYADSYLDIVLSKNLTDHFINSKSNKGLSAFHIAVNKNYTNAINKLDKYIDITDITNIDLFDFLLKPDNDYIEKYPLKGQRLLFGVISLNVHKYNYLIKKYIDRIDKNILVNYRFEYRDIFTNFSILDVAIYINNVDAIKMFLSYDLTVQKEPFIFNISKISDYEVIVPLLAKYFDESLINSVDESNNNITPLINAVKWNNLLLVKKFINTPNIIISKQDRLGKTCLHYASHNASTYIDNAKNVAFEIVKLLIDKYPALTDIKDKTGAGPGNKQIAVAANVRNYIKSRKSGLFKQNPNIEKNKRDNGNKKVGAKRSATKRSDRKRSDRNRSDKKSQRKTRKYK